MSNIKYSRVLLKISGESLCKSGGFGIDSQQSISIAKRISSICKLGSQVAIVNGGGNFLRGAAFSKDGIFPRSTSDYMGMLATIMNSAALKETLEYCGQPAIVLSAIAVPAIAELFTRTRALEELNSGKVVILSGGTGNPFFSTDTCAALRASEIEADLIIKATKVDGVYDDDPVKNPDAKLIKEIRYQDIISNDLKIMDHAAVSLCRENDIPVRVINIFKEGNIKDTLNGKDIGTIIC